MNTPREQAPLAKNYRLVYDILRTQKRGTHLAMADVFALARTAKAGIGFTTVYRAISRLRDLGLVSEISVPGADAAYYETAGDTHAHFRCNVCGSLRDVAYALPEPVTKDIAQRGDVSISDVSISFHGTCATCRQMKPTT